MKFKLTPFSAFSATAQQRNSATAQQRNSATAQQRNFFNLLSYGFIFLYMGLFIHTSAQTFVPTTTSETQYPGYTFNPVAPNAVPGLFANSSKTNIFSPFFPEVSSWTEDDGAGWEDGYFAYGYANPFGIYTSVDTVQIKGAKHLSVAYMESGGRAFLVAVYTLRIPTYDSISNCLYTPSGYSEYAHEMRVYDLASISGPITLNHIERVSSINPKPYLSCHPLYGIYSPWEPDFACDGNLVMDVNYSKDKIACAWTGNCGAVQATVFDLTGSGAMINKAIGTIAAYPATNPLDMAFWRDTNIITRVDTDYFSVLIQDSVSPRHGVFVATVNFDVFYSRIISSMPIIKYYDDTTLLPYGTTFFTAGYPVAASPIDHIKLDVPDISNDRRWAYTWSDGNNIYLRRFVGPSTSPGAPVSVPTTEIVNNGSLVSSMPPVNAIKSINMYHNEMPAIQFRKNTTTGLYNTHLAWRTDANMMSTSTFNWVGLELEETIPWPTPPTVKSTLDYLNVQSNPSNRATEYIALSHCEDLPFLYTSFLQNDSLGIQYLYHKNHDYTVSAFWKQSTDSTLSIGATDITVGPNPFKEQLVIKSNEPLKIIVYDISGRQIINTKGSAEVLNQHINERIQSLQAGLYLLKVYRDNGELFNIYKLSRKE